MCSRSSPGPAAVALEEAQTLCMAPVTGLEVGTGGWSSQATMQPVKMGPLSISPRETHSELSHLSVSVITCLLINVLKVSDWQVTSHDHTVPGSLPTFSNRAFTTFSPPCPHLYLIQSSNFSIPQGRHKTCSISLSSFSSVAFSPDLYFWWINFRHK